MNLWRVFFIFCFSLLWQLSVCADPVILPPVHAPTINLEKTPKYPKKKKASGPVLLDARPTFDFAMGHVKNSMLIRWQDYAQTEEPHKGSLDPDLDFLARKLRVLGISPERDVIVIGNGSKGRAEEGRIAWMLLYLGIKKVTLKNVIHVLARKTLDDENTERDSAPIWIPHPIQSLRVQKRDIESIVEEHQEKNQSHPQTSHSVIIDVRSPEEFSAKPASGKPGGHIPGAINLPWTLLFSKEDEILTGDPLIQVLKSRGIDVSKNLIFYSSLGLESGLATFAAFKSDLKASHYDGSFVEWAGDGHLKTE